MGPPAISPAAEAWGYISKLSLVFLEPSKVRKWGLSLAKFLRVESATLEMSAHATATDMLSDCSAAIFRFRTKTKAR
jgi:hypothetical protein